MTAVLRRYFRGAKLNTMEDVVAGKKYVYHFDHQGSTQALTDATTGAVTDRFASDAWGVPVKRTGSAQNSLWFAGNSSYDASRQSQRLYVRSRWLESDRGRWLPALQNEGDSHYSYAGNHPAETVLPMAQVKTAIKISKPTLEAAGPAYRGYCGAALFEIKWSNPGNQRSGWIIQHVTLSGSLEWCDRSRPEMGANLSYWEAWKVENGRLGPSFFKPKTVLPNDAFRTRNVGLGTKSKKEFTVRGVAQFWEGYQLTRPPWLCNGPNDKHPALDLPWKPDGPQGWSDKHPSSAVHELTVTWNCCACPPKLAYSNITTKPKVSVELKPTLP